MRPTLGILITATTYGTWLRGDRRGWIDDGRLMPPCPELEAADRLRMKHPPFLFASDQLWDVGRLMAVARDAARGAYSCSPRWLVAFPSRGRRATRGLAGGREMREGRRSFRFAAEPAHLDRRLRQTLLLRRSIPAPPHPIRRTPQRTRRPPPAPMAIHHNAAPPHVPPLAPGSSNRGRSRPTPRQTHHHKNH